ncbi:MAG: glycosyltransferase family 2 protein [Flavobacterium sp.]|nr:glycosyltransferase family 2 protein [Flavobacterium sp.]
MKIIAVIVTYNRINLLKECVTALRTQTKKPCEIIIINNNSSDGTTDWLNEQKDIIHKVLPNRGGAFGFYEGIKHAYTQQGDWIWLMDDDTIPHHSALMHLTNTLTLTILESNNPKVGFLASRVLWTDGSEHLMNKQLKITTQKYPINDIFAIDGSTFVSLLVSREAIKTVGLPIKEFFIWGDDIEFTKRIQQNGFEGLLAIKSEVIHKTFTNYKCSIYDDTNSNLWKYKFGLRNELYTRKKYKGKASFYRHILKRIFYWPLLICINRKDNKLDFIKVVWKTSLQSLLFNPSIEYLE